MLLTPKLQNAIHNLFETLEDCIDPAKDAESHKVIQYWYEHAQDTSRNMSIRVYPKKYKNSTFNK